jgi:hypothetical protein
MPSLPPNQIELLGRMYLADKRDSSALHDFKDLMPEASRDDLDVAYEDFRHYGFLHKASGQTFGGPFGRLSTVGRGYVENLEDERKPTPTGVSPAAPIDQYFRFAGGTVIVREESTEAPWLLTWLPDDPGDPSYPGFTATSETLDFPTTHGAGGILEWSAKQAWARRAAGEETETDAPEGAQSIEVPAAEAASFSEQVHMEHGFRFAFTKELDASFTWAVLTEDGFTLLSGVADTWADTLLAAVENLQPPSDEAS